MGKSQRSPRYSLAQCIANKAMNKFIKFILQIIKLEKSLETVCQSE